MRAEVHGTWSHGPHGDLVLPLAAPAPGPLALSVLLAPTLCPARPRLRVRASLGRRPVARWTFTGASPGGWRSATLPVRPGRRTVRLGFSADAPASPHALGLETDVRILGFVLGRRRLDAAS